MFDTEIKNILKQLDFQRPVELSAAVAPFLQETRVAAELRRFLTAIHNAAQGNVAALMPWLFYRSGHIDLSDVHYLIRFMASDYLSLKGLKLEVDIAGCLVLSVADFSKAQLSGIHNPLQAHYLFRFTHEDTAIRTPLFSFGYLDDLAFHVLSHFCSVAGHQVEENWRGFSAINLIKASLARSQRVDDALSLSERITLKDHLVIVLRLSQFLRQQAAQPNRLYRFLLQRVATRHSHLSLSTLYQEFCARQNPLNARLLALSDHMIQPVDRQWHRYENSSWYRLGKIIYFIFLTLSIALMIYVQHMPSLWLLLPLAMMTMLHCGVGADKSIGILIPFIKMPLQLMMASYLANEFMERQWWQVQRESNLLALSICSFAVTVDIISDVFNAYCILQEKQAYIKAVNTQYIPDSLGVVKGALTSGVRKASQYVSWMVFPYVSMEALMHLLHAERCVPLFYIHWPAAFNHAKLFLSVTAAGYHYRKMQQANHPVVKAFQKQKLVHFGFEASISLMTLMIYPALFKEKIVMGNNIMSMPSSLSAPAFAQTVKGSVNGFSSWYFMFFSTARPDSQWVETSSTDLLMLLSAPDTCAVWSATPWSLSQGVVSRVDDGMKYFGSAQCPVNMLTAVISLLGQQTLNVLRPLSQSAVSVKAQGVTVPTTLFFSTIPAVNLDKAAEAVVQYPSAMTQFMQFIIRAATVECRVQPRI